MIGCFSCSPRSRSNMKAPTSAAFCISEVFNSSIVLSAAAHDTGLPPNVLACEPGGHAITSALAVVTPNGIPDATPFATATMSGSTPKCSIANIFPVRPMPDCTSSAISSMPCFFVSSRSRS